jgi:hypothetical protein
MNEKFFGSMSAVLAVTRSTEKCSATTCTNLWRTVPKFPFQHRIYRSACIIDENFLRKLGGNGFVDLRVFCENFAIDRLRRALAHVLMITKTPTTRPRLHHICQRVAFFFVAVVTIGLINYYASMQTNSIFFLVGRRFAVGGKSPRATSSSLSSKACVDSHAYFQIRKHFPSPGAKIPSTRVRRTQEFGSVVQIKAAANARGLLLLTIFHFQLSLLDNISTWVMDLLLIAFFSPAIDKPHEMFLHNDLNCNQAERR